MQHVYLAKIPNKDGKGELFPAQRQAELLSCTNVGVRRQKYYVWRLLEYALRHALALDIHDLEFVKMKSGKWTSQGCCFSLSHSHNAVAVAVSHGEIGVDVELLNAKKEDFLQTTLTAAEGKEYAKIASPARLEYLFGKWTQKESVFKKVGDGLFRPSKIVLDGQFTDTRKIALDGEEYMLSVAANDIADVRYYLDVDISE